MDDLARQLINAGLIQFGAFVRDGETLPVDLHLSMIGSYPDLLDSLAALAAEAVRGTNATHLLSTSDAIPFATAISLRMRLPLVYSRGGGEAAVFDLVGAYDIGHPALLVTNSIGFDVSPSELAQSARRVGLEIHTVIAILKARTDMPARDVNVVPLFRLRDVVNDMAASGALPNGQARRVLGWLERSEIDGV